MSDLIPGWQCTHCRVFNGEVKAKLRRCRACDASRGAPKVMSPRGYLLALSTTLQFEDQDVLTVELASKWYGLIVVKPNLDVRKIEVREIDFSTFSDPPLADPPYVDHVPNPLAVRLFAEKMSWHLDELAEQLILGRWADEANGIGVELEEARRNEREACAKIADGYGDADLATAMTAEAIARSIRQRGRR